MRIRFSRQTNQGLTLVEAVVVIFVIAFLVLLLVPAASYSPYHGGQRISCINNLKQLGLAIRVWGGDNHDQYPMAVSVTNGGAMEWMTTPDAWKVFGVMSNELSTPKIIYCPQDAFHGRSATNFNDDLKTHISYFIGADATDADPQLLLAGDDNFLLNQRPVSPGMVDPAYNAMLEWDASRHTEETIQGWFIKAKKSRYGNICLTDGSVQVATSSGLTNLLHQASLATNRLFIP